MVPVVAPSEGMGYAPASKPLAVELPARQCIEPSPHCPRGRVAPRSGGSQDAHAIEFAFAGERLWINDKPRLALSHEDVPAVKILVHE